MSLRILIAGEVVGKPGIVVVKNFVSSFRQRKRIDFVVSGNNFTTGFRGLCKRHAFLLKKYGIDVLTLGENAFVRAELSDELDKYSFILKPLNYPTRLRGHSYFVYNVNGCKVAVIRLVGQTGITKYNFNNPFFAFDYVYEKIKLYTNNIIVLFDSSTTAEVNAMFFYLKSRASACLGIGKRILTADLRIFDDTAVITDLGRVGSLDSVIGYSPKFEIDKFLRGFLNNRFTESWDGLGFNGVIVEIDDGKAVAVEVVREYIDFDGGVENNSTI
ncbi:YmdB family metallophosphoesterase [Borrelia coriaceae]|uniref:TIGR00282 family metallophosphoesterase n=1 Tax=Borrelia coriaceae TaxID=144 RepID=UPI00046CCE97|nr:YmdB family metallophosphoesterase [Borrelia coriaceae]UPA16330.1 YmdB family metallophosphoesterase [Borrelia coriaceae]